MTYKIRRLSENEAVLPIGWARILGWNPGLNDAEIFYFTDPKGFFCGTIDDRIVAVGSAVVYDDNFAFCGLYIVNPVYQRKGYGMQLTKARLEYCGDRNVGIDGVIDNIGIYEKLGYELHYRNARYQFTAVRTLFEHPNVCDLTNGSIDMTCLLRYDRQCFPAKRETFLKAWLSQKDVFARAFIIDGELKGYVVRRKCYDGYKIGPLFADDPEIARHLLAACQTGIDGETLYLDVPEINDAAVEMAVKFNMKQVFATARMYLHGLPVLDYHKIYGNTTFELG